MSKRDVITSAPNSGGAFQRPPLSGTGGGVAKPSGPAKTVGKPKGGIDNLKPSKGK